MNQFTQKPIQFQAVRFDGGIDNATTIINWLAQEYNVDAYYKPERIVRPLDSEMQSYTDDESLYIVTNRDSGNRTVRVGNWIMPDGPEGRRRFDVYDDESIQHFFNPVA